MRSGWRRLQGMIFAHSLTHSVCRTPEQRTEGAIAMPHSCNHSGLSSKIQNLHRVSVNIRLRMLPPRKEGGNAANAGSRCRFLMAVSRVFIFTQFKNSG